MLHALATHKVNLRSFRGKGVRVPAEDVVTSTVFGPLEFLAPGDRAVLLERLFARLDLSVECDWATAQLDFWSKQSGVHPAFRPQYIEPDLILRDQSGIAAIIEIKWGARLEPYELAGQWSSLDEAARDRALHLFIVREPASYSKAVAADRRALRDIGVGSWPLHTRSWRGFATALDALCSDPELPPHTCQWARHVARMLVREDGISLIGWTEIALLPIDTIKWRFTRRWFDRLVPLERREGWWTE